MKKQLKILVIEDDEDDYFILNEYLKSNSNYEWNIHWESTLDKIDNLDLTQFDIFLVDFYIGGNTAFDFLSYLKQNSIAIPAIILTGLSDREKDLELMSMGATDYLIKEKLDADKIERVIRYAIQRSNANKQLILERNKFLNLFKNSLDGIFILDKQLNVIDINSVAKKIFSISKDEALGLSIDQIVSHKIIDEFVFSPRTVNNKEISLTLNSSEEFKCLLSIVPIHNSMDQVTMYKISIRDTNELYIAKEKANKIDRINFSGRMARVVAHEIRNPLSNINLSASFLSSEIADKENLEYVSMIQKNSVKINEIVTNFLEQTQKVQLTLERNSVHSLIKKSIELCRDRFTLSGIPLEENLGDDSEIMADVEKLPLVFSNIILNGIDAQAESTNPKILLESELVDDKIVICITDNGVGMNKATLDNLFEPFFTKKKTGLGIGMVAVDNIISQHNAYIKVESKLGEGTTFKFIFDLAS